VQGNKFAKIVASFLIFAMVLFSTPAVILADPVTPGPTGTPEEPETTESPGAQSSPNPGSGSGGTTNNPASGATTNSNTDSTENKNKDYICGGRTISTLSRIYNFLNSNPIATFFEESLCLAIIVAGLVAGNLACWLISTFIEPVFPRQGSGKTCKPDDSLDNPNAPRDPAASSSGGNTSGSGGGNTNSGSLDNDTPSTSPPTSTPIPDTNTDGTVGKVFELSGSILS
jgi:hypothetical protein